MYPITLEIKDTADTVKSASFLDLHLEVDGKRKLLTKLHDKHDDFHSILSTFLSSVVASLQHLRVEFSYHN